MDDWMVEKKDNCVVREREKRVQELSYLTLH